jgi:hypothetical protein
VLGTFFQNAKSFLGYLLKLKYKYFKPKVFMSRKFTNFTVSE